MRRLLFLCGVLLTPLLMAGPALGQAGTIGIYADVYGAQPYINDTEPGIIECYVIHKNAAGATACEFSAPLPDCFNGTYLGEQNRFGVTIGNSQDGVAIGYAGCWMRSVHVMTIQLFCEGPTDDLCEWKVLPSPNSDLGSVAMTDCDFEMWPADGGTAFFREEALPCSQPALTMTRYETVDWSWPNWTVRIEMVNSGLAEARNVSVAMHEDIPWLRLPDASCYYGTVGANDSTWGGGDVFTLDLSDHPGGSFNAWFDVTYRDTCGAPHTIRIDPEFDPQAIESVEPNTPDVAELTDGSLGQNYPNPFNPITTIPVDLRESMDVRLSIFDSRGALVRVLADNRLPAGLREYVWDGRDTNGNTVSSGIYFCRLTTGAEIQTRKLVFLK